VPPRTRRGWVSGALVGPGRGSPDQSLKPPVTQGVMYPQKGCYSAEATVAVVPEAPVGGGEDRGELTRNASTRKAPTGGTLYPRAAGGFGSGCIPPSAGSLADRFSPSVSRHQPLPAAPRLPKIEGRNRERRCGEHPENPTHVNDEQRDECHHQADDRCDLPLPTGPSHPSASVSPTPAARRLRGPRIGRRTIRNEATFHLGT
jgi:hypothetical protein